MPSSKPDLLPVLEDLHRDLVQALGLEMTNIGREGGDFIFLWTLKWFHRNLVISCRKNNLAAKKSRDTRRMRENQLRLRVLFLENANKVLREQMERKEQESGKLRYVSHEFTIKEKLALYLHFSEKDWDCMRVVKQTATATIIISKIFVELLGDTCHGDINDSWYSYSSHKLINIDRSCYKMT